MPNTNFYKNKLILYQKEKATNCAWPRYKYSVTGLLVY